MSKRIFNINSASSLNEIALEIKKLCTANKIFIINGEMGAGKTTLISKVCKLLEIKDEPSSPTYSIVNTYISEKFGEIYHFDFYRIKNENEAIESGLDEMIYSNNICFIEWAEKIKKLLPSHCIIIDIKILNNNNRKITITI